MNIIIDPEFKALIMDADTAKVDGALSQRQLELQVLEENIVADGCREPLVLWAGHNILLDGHNRYEICTRLNIPYQTVELSFDSREDAMDWIDTNQIGRRNLSPNTLKLIRGRIYHRTKQDKQENLVQNSPKGHNDPSDETRSGGSSPKTQVDKKTPTGTAEKLAKRFGVSPKTIKRNGKLAEAVEELKDTVPDIEKQVAAGRVSDKAVVAAAKVVADDPEKAKGIIAGDKPVEKFMQRSAKRNNAIADGLRLLKWLVDENKNDALATYIEATKTMLIELGATKDEMSL